jgi:drug/metabolite transporter (DMT)-like permease
MATGRVLIGGLALVAWIAWIGVRADLARDWRAYLFIGVLNSSLPFLLFGYAALHLPASYLVILNAATPLFGALASAIWLSERLTVLKVAALIVGALGVALVSRAGPLVPDANFALAVAASLCAALCYALAGVWLKKRGAHLPSTAVAAWSQVFAGIALLPIAAVMPAPATIDGLVIVNLLLLGLVCSGVAYVLYYRLIAEAGPTRAMTVTFLMPAFGMLWGALFLHETVTLAMIAGAVLIVSGTALVLRPSRAGPRISRAIAPNQR